jgi:hypothetical protein
MEPGDAAGTLVRPIRHGAVHDNPDDKLDLFQYDFTSRERAGATLSRSGGCGPSLREEQPAARQLQPLHDKKTT